MSHFLLWEVAGNCWDVKALKGFAQKFSHHKELTEVQGT